MIRASSAMSSFRLASGQMDPVPVGIILLKDIGNSVDRFKMAKSTASQTRKPRDIRDKYGARENGDFPSLKNSRSSR